MIEIFQIITLVMIGIFGSICVLTRNPLKQAILIGFYGFLLSILFLVLQAPEVALSEIVVGSAAVPLIILLALAKIKGYMLEKKEKNK
jgi:energy-converting hydrogenase B subunit D